MISILFECILQESVTSFNSEFREHWSKMYLTMFCCTTVQYLVKHTRKGQIKCVIVGKNCKV